MYDFIIHQDVVVAILLLRVNQHQFQLMESPRYLNEYVNMVVLNRESALLCATRSDPEAWGPFY